jgi:prepilin-type N-terminal cleavage/methylation domain-containing protein
MKLKRAFSLIELSIVTLVIGILIAGIMQGTSLYVKMKLATARSVTQSSPANGVSDLVLWLETTSEASFPTSLDDQSPVSTWNDINPQQTNKSDATASDEARPLYVANGINGLPALKCDGIDDLISVPSGTNYYPTGAPSITNNFTIFLVAYPDDIDHEIDIEAIAGAASKKGTAGQKYILGALHGGIYGSTADIVGAGISLGTNGVSIYEHGSSYMAPLAVYNGSNGLSAPVIITLNYKNKTPTIFINGTSVQVGLTSLKTSVFPPVEFCSGLHGAFSGKIGEVIIYGKLVPAAKRAQIEKYLGKKWGIKVA